MNQDIKAERKRRGFEFLKHSMDRGSSGYLIHIKVISIFFLSWFVVCLNSLVFHRPVCFKIGVSDWIFVACSRTESSTLVFYILNVLYRPGMVCVEETIPNLYAFHTCVHTYLNSALKMDLCWKGKKLHVWSNDPCRCNNNTLWCPLQKDLDVEWLCFLLHSSVSVTFHIWKQPY